MDKFKKEIEEIKRIEDDNKINVLTKKTSKQMVIEQILLQEEIQKVANINIVTCGHCGDVLLHRISDEVVTCPFCGTKEDQCNFPDFLYRGCEDNYEDKILEYIPEFLIDAMDKITVKMLLNLEHGEEIELNSEYSLYHYTEDDIFVINRNEDWEEMYQVLYSLHEENNQITFEKI